MESWAASSQESSTSRVQRPSHAGLHRIKSERFYKTVEGAEFDHFMRALVVADSGRDDHRSSRKLLTNMRKVLCAQDK